MTEHKETIKQYCIPDNFIEEGRVFQGRIRVRNLIEGILMGLVFGAAGIVLILVYPAMSLEAKVAIVAVFAAPPFLIGIAGFNGDSISVTIKSFLEWLKNKNTMLYNTNPRLLKRDPLLTVINQTTTRDRILEDIEEKRKDIVRKKAELVMEEGQDYIFEEDVHVDVFTKRLQRSVAESKGKQAKEYLITPAKQYSRVFGPFAYHPDQELDLEDDSPDAAEFISYTAPSSSASVLSRNDRKED